MKLSNLSGFPKEIEDFVEVKIPELDIEVFWTPEGGGRLCEKKTGSCIFKGSLSRCRASLKKMMANGEVDRLKKILETYPTVEEFEDARRKLIKLHRRYRILTGTKLKKEMNSNSIAGDFYVRNFPDTEDEQIKAVFWRIGKIQERKLKNEKE